MSNIVEKQTFSKLRFSGFKKLLIKMQYISVFLDIAKFADFQWKNADFCRTQGVYYVIHIFFGSSLGEI